MIDLLFLIMYTCFLVNITTQLSSHNCPTDSNDSFDISGYTSADFAVVDTCLGNGSVSSCVGDIILLLGKIAMGPSKMSVNPCKCILSFVFTKHFTAPVCAFNVSTGCKIFVEATRCVL